MTSLTHQFTDSGDPLLCSVMVQSATQPDRPVRQCGHRGTYLHPDGYQICARHAKAMGISRQRDGWWIYRIGKKTNRPTLGFYRNNKLYASFDHPDYDPPTKFGQELTPLQPMLGPSNIRLDPDEIDWAFTYLTKLYPWEPATVFWEKRWCTPPGKDMYHLEGMISPEGDWYPLDYNGHNTFVHYMMTQRYGAKNSQYQTSTDVLRSRSWISGHPPTAINRTQYLWMGRGADLGWGNATEAQIAFLQCVLNEAPPLNAEDGSEAIVNCITDFLAHNEMGRQQLERERNGN